MRRSTKIFSSIIFSIIILIIAALVILPHVINPNDYKQLIDQYVYKKTGHHLIIKGKIGWSFFPWLGIQVKQVEVSNPAGFQGPPLATIGDLQLKIKLFSLFFGAVETDTILIANATINLITSKDGKTNWSNWTQPNQDIPQSTDSKITKPSTETSKNNAPPELPNIHIESINISDSKINLINDKTKQTTTLSDFNFSSKGIRLKKNFPINLNFTMQQNNSNVKIKTQTSAVANLDNVTRIIKISSLKIENQVFRPNLNTLTVNTQGEMLLNLLQQTLKLNIKDTAIAKNHMNGKIFINKLFQTPEISIDLLANNINIKTLLVALRGSSFIDGTMKFSTNLTTSGEAKQVLLNNLNGKGNLLITNGTLYGINIYAILNKAASLINKKQETSNSESQTSTTSFTQLSASYTIQKGILKNDDLQIISGEAKTLGSGNINLPKQTINYELKTQYNKQPIQIAGVKTDVPIKIYGKLSSPKISPDFAAITKQTLIDQIKSKTKKIGIDIKNLFSD